MQPASSPSTRLTGLRRLLGLIGRPAETVPPVAPRPIPERHVEPSRVGQGSRSSRRHRQGVTRIVVAVEDDLFERIRARAVGKECSIAAEVRHLLECGLAAAAKKER